MQDKDNILIVDWFSFTTKIFVEGTDFVYSIADIIDLLGLTESNLKWQNIYGMHGYKDRYYFDGISIHYNSTNRDLWVEMSGAGCRTFETYSKFDFYDIFDIIKSDLKRFHITRLDIALDDRSELLTLETIERETSLKNYRSRFRDIRLEKSFTSNAFTFYYGSMSSDIMFRIYNKAVERNREDEGSWVRFEIQMRNERALSFIQQLTTTNIGEIFFGVINHYISYLKPSSDSNKARWALADWWSDFLQYSNITMITPCEKEYNFLNLQNYVINQSGGAVQTYIKLCGEDQLIDDLKNRSARLNPKYKTLLDELQTE